MFVVRYLYISPDLCREGEQIRRLNDIRALEAAVAVRTPAGGTVAVAQSTTRRLLLREPPSHMAVRSPSSLAVFGPGADRVGRGR